jgi:diguanylate cyclase (GGDEF)-like protein
MFLFLLLIAAVVGVGWVDLATGPELSFSLFYLIPITIAGFYQGRGSAFAVALVAAVCWFAADIVLQPEGHFLISIWNGITRFGIFVGIGQLVAIVNRDRVRIRKMLDSEALTARTDPVTGLPNSRAFREILQTELARSRRLGLSMSMIYIDLDNFKNVNDAFGHAGGDELLQCVGATLREAVRQTDTIARLGGDEFAVFAWNANAEVLNEIAARIVDSITVLGRWYPGTGFGASAGTAFFDSPPNDIDEIIQQADAAMYQAKQVGKVQRKDNAPNCPALIKKQSIVR